MSTNLIQNFKLNTPSQPIQEKKPKPDFDIQRELNNRTFIKPLKGRGRLVSGGVFNAPALLVKDVKYDIKALKHAMSGNANDHELGKLNDLGLMAGGLAIAGYLFTRRQTPKTKGMEFVGLGAFLASMAIWPKLAIQLPAYLIHGVNVQKEYQDSFGRRKPFYQDPQFIPWDLYSDKEIQKMGDRLGIEKNIPNRRDAIQEKMKKIAIQNNTLWMLTAGFASPVMTALACNAVEPYFENYLDKMKNKKADSILTNVEEYAQRKYKNNEIANRLSKIEVESKGKTVDDSIKKAIVNAFTEDLDTITARSVEYDINKMLSGNLYTVEENSSKAIYDNLIQKGLKKNIEEETLKAVIPSEERILQILKDNNYIGDVKSGSFQRINNYILADVRANVEEYNKKASPDKQLKRFMRVLLDGEHPIKTVLSQTPTIKLEGELLENLKKCASVFDKFNANNYALDEYALLKVGNAPETVIAKYWNDVSGDLLKILGISDKEFEKVKLHRNIMSEMLRDKIETIVSDDAKYEKVMDTLVGKISEINKKIPEIKNTFNVLKDGLDEGTRKNLRSDYEVKVDKIFDDFAEKIRHLGFEKSSKAIVGAYAGDNTGTYKNIQKSYMSDRLLGVKSSFSRLLTTLDFYRRAAKNPNGLVGLGLQCREVREELIELCKTITLQGHSSDYAVKFYMQRNPHPNLEDNTPVEVENGKIKNKYLGKAQGTTNIPDDKYFYQNAMQAMFEGEMDDITSRVLDKYTYKEEISSYRELMLDKIGSDRYFAKPRHLIRPTRETFSGVKFNLIGIATDELVFKSGNSLWNSNKWFKMAAGFGAGLLGLTVMAQFFFGKVKKASQKAGNND